jgi:hypothetical protein
MFTDWFFRHPMWWLLMPISWLVGSAVLSRRPAIASDSALLFAGTFIVAAAFLAGVLLIAAILPLLTFKA